MSWLAQHGFTLLQSAGIIGSLIFTGLQLNLDARSRRVENRLDITRQHREIWRNFSSDPTLSRVLIEHADLDTTPITQHERVFVTSIILHLNAAFTAYREGMAPIPEGLSADVQEFFSKPIPSSVWNESKQMRDAEFRRFVDSVIPVDAQGDRS